VTYRVGSASISISHQGKERNFFPILLNAFFFLKECDVVRRISVRQVPITEHMEILLVGIWVI
jgi:hypothetical protein